MGRECTLNNMCGKLTVYLGNVNVGREKIFLQGIYMFRVDEWPPPRDLFMSYIYNSFCRIQQNRSFC